MQVDDLPIGRDTVLPIQSTTQFIFLCSAIHIYTRRHRWPSEQLSEAIWSLVACPRTLRHAAGARDRTTDLTSGLTLPPEPHV